MLPLTMHIQSSLPEFFQHLFDVDATVFVIVICLGCCPHVSAILQVCCSRKEFVNQWLSLVFQRNVAHDAKQFTPAFTQNIWKLPCRVFSSYFWWQIWDIRVACVCIFTTRNKKWGLVTRGSVSQMWPNLEKKGQNCKVVQIFVLLLWSQHCYFLDLFIKR